MTLYFLWAAVSVPGKPEMQLVGWRWSWFVGLWKSRKGRFFCRIHCTGCPCMWRCIRQWYHSLSFKDDYLKWNLGRTIRVTWPIISFFSRVVKHLHDHLVCYCPLFFLCGLLTSDQGSSLLRLEVWWPPRVAMMMMTKVFKYESYSLSVTKCSAGKWSVSCPVEWKAHTHTHPVYGSQPLAAPYLLITHVGLMAPQLSTVSEFLCPSSVPRVLWRWRFL